MTIRDLRPGDVVTDTVTGRMQTSFGIRGSFALTVGRLLIFSQNGLKPLTLSEGEFSARCMVVRDGKIIKEPGDEATRRRIAILEETLAAHRLNNEPAVITEAYEREIERLKLEGIRE